MPNFHELEDIPKPKRNPQNEDKTTNPAYVDFDKYMVNKITFLNLRIKISGKDVDTGSTLTTVSNKTQMMAKFTRNVKCASKKHLNDEDLNLGITESLTSKRLQLLKLAKEKF